MSWCQGRWSPRQGAYPRATWRELCLASIVAIVLVAGAIPLDELLNRLSIRRPVFHSERDFQLELAWEAKLADPGIQVFLETRPARGMHLDVAFEKDGCYTAVELKYLTRGWSGEVNGQHYDLKTHSAHDRGRYGVVRDVWRVEQFASRPNSNGAVVVLTNDPSYLSPSSRASRDAAFRIHDGAVLAGLRAWDGSPPSRDMVDLKLAGSYQLQWSDYSTGDIGPRLWQLVIEVDRGVG